MLGKHYSKKIKMMIGSITIAGIVGGLIFGTQLDGAGALASITSINGTKSFIERQQPEALFPVYDLYINEAIVGTLSDRGQVAEFIQLAKEDVTAEIHYTPDFEYTIRVEERMVDQFEESQEALIEAMHDALYLSAGEIKVRAYAMKIDDFYVVLASREDLITVLENAQSLYVQDNSAISVDLVSDSHNPMVLTPEINILSKELPEERIFVTSDMTNAPEEVDGQPMEDLEADHDQFIEAVVKEVRLNQQIVVVETFVTADELTDVETATDLITKEHEKEKTYKVSSGDSPSVIAVENSMTTTELYNLNPGLKENSTKMQIGDELVVMVPEPELFVTTVEDVIYTEIIDRDIVYVNNPDEYIGTNSVIKEGADGVIEVRATVEKLNGQIINEEVIETTKILDPVTETQTRGVKALPVTTATGTFEMPMLSYTFTSGYGYRWGRLHTGIDLAAPVGTAIKASDGGRVIMAGWDGGYGYSIEIDHGKGLVTKYAHCSKMYVSVGEEVSQYQTIAAVGNTGNSTGPHLHFEIRVWDTPVDPMSRLN